MDSFYHNILSNFISFVNHITVVYLFVVNGTYLTMLVLAFKAIRKHLKEIQLVKFKRIFHSPFFKPISIIVPAYNEEATIVDNVESLLQIHYPLYEIILVNDGSSDQTLKKLADRFNFTPSENVVRHQVACSEILGIYTSPDYPKLILVDKVNGGSKSDAINAGINVSKFPLFCAIDADSLLEPDVLLRLIRPFIEDPSTVAAGGTVRISNGCTVKNGYITQVRLPKSLIGKFQILEYLRAFLSGRVAFSAINGLIIISGAFGLFKKEAVIQVGGYKEGIIGEDMELVVRLHRELTKNNIPYRVAFVPEPVCWTEAPETLKILKRQRKRWQRGLMESLFGNKEILFNFKYGVIGWFVFPFFLFIEGLGCFIEFFGVILLLTSWYLDLINPTLLLLFFIGGIVLNIFLSLGTILFEEFSLRRYPLLSDVIILSLLPFIEVFIYRPFQVWWRILGSCEYFFNMPAKWGQMERSGFATKPK